MSTTIVCHDVFVTFVHFAKEQSSNYRISILLNSGSGWCIFEVQKFYDLNFLQIFIQRQQFYNMEKRVKLKCLCWW